MAQTNYTPIALYYSTTASATPTSGNLVNGELAINITDGKLYYKDNSNTVRLLASNATSAPVLTVSFGSTGLTPSTATSGAISVAGTLVAANGGTGQSTYATGDLLYASGATALSKLTLGTTNYVLTAGASAPQYVAQSTLTAGAANAIANTGGWAVTPSGTKLYFSYNGVNVASLDSSGNFIAKANVTAYGTP